MIAFVIVDPDAGDRNSWGFFVMRDADGKLYFCCEEYIMKTPSIQAAMNWKISNAEDWTDWNPQDDLQPATIVDVEQAGLMTYITGELDSETGVWLWRRESDSTLP